MFEVGFSELLLIMGLALLVLGPEKLPKVVTEIGRWMGRARAMARQFREQLEVEAAESARRKTTSTPETAAASATPEPTPELVPEPTAAATPAPPLDPTPAPTPTPIRPDAAAPVQDDERRAP